MNKQKTVQIVNQTWDASIIPTLSEYIRIPNKSPTFDPQWQNNGHMERAVTLLSRWCQQQSINNMKLEVHRSPGRTPLLVMDIAGQSAETVILYGHLDKQPEIAGWDIGLDPWQPVRKGERLYGRGGADDGYATFAALTAIKALQQQNIPHARCVIIIEASEESGSTDLPFYIEQLKEQIGTPSLIICLDSGAGNYQQLWCTTSLRGLINAELSVSILTEGVHSGAASGAVASSFRILRQLLSRIENETTGKILLPALQVKIPANRITEAKTVAKVLGNKVWQNYPFIERAKPVSKKNDELILNRTWKPALSITGIDGIPSMQMAGNVLRATTSALLSMRLPPTCDAKKAAVALKRILEAQPPYRAKVRFKLRDCASGWNAPKMEPWLAAAVNTASKTFYGKNALYWGEGGSIPFMGMLGKKFPKAQFVVTGVLGPHSNAHGPNEFLDIPMAKKLTSCVASILAAHYHAHAI